MSKISLIIVCPVVSQEVLAKAAAARHADEKQRLERLTQLRNEDRARLANHRLRREKVKPRFHWTDLLETCWKHFNVLKTSLDYTQVPSS